MAVHLAQVKLLDAGDMSGDVYSVEWDIAQFSNVCVHNVWTGTPTGNVITQLSIDGTTWVDLDTQAAGGAAGNAMVDIVTGASKLRVFWDDTSGSGALTVHASGKA